MKKLAILALAAAATTAFAGAGQAEARTGAASATTKTATATGASKAQVRYAWVKSCRKKDYTVPCGPWTLSLRNGKTLPLTDARVFPVTYEGKGDKESSTSIAVSGNGRKVAYFRKSDGKLVVRDLASGKVNALPGKAARLPKGVGMGDLDIFLSPAGDAAVIDYFDQDAKAPSLIVDLKSGKIRKLAAHSVVQGFSPDGTRVLVTDATAENTTEFAVYDEIGHKTNSQIVPQVVANNTPIALGDDGTSVALIITTPAGKQRLRVYDLASDTVGDAVNVKVPASETANRLEWASDDSLTIWELLNDSNGNAVGATARHLDPSSGSTSKIDSFKIKSKAWAWWLPGE
ncbi:hypothetical protein [Planotetraspora sp. GP83]|uniref:hypothetical protein n=1 Tax=Planotetraspora sp. GP83 TaxID=3156264 RepID=UPI003518A077